MSRQDVLEARVTEIQEAAMQEWNRWKEIDNRLRNLEGRSVEMSAGIQP